ncbi:Amino acid permease, partial [Spraguea lophii 42_110]
MKSISKYFSVVGNLLKAMLGSGFLPMPTLYYYYGIMPTTILLVLGAISGMIGFNLFLTLNAYYGKNSTLSTLAYEICPVLRYVADIAVCLKCLMVSLAYIVLIKNQIDIVVKVLNLPFSSKIPLLIFVLFVIVISSLGKFDKLKYTSLIGLCALLIMMLLSFFLIKKVHHIPMFNIKLNVLGKLGSFVYAFTCHQA